MMVVDSKVSGPQAFSGATVMGELRNATGVDAGSGCSRPAAVLVLDSACNARPGLAQPACGLPHLTPAHRAGCRRQLNTDHGAAGWFLSTVATLPRSWRLCCRRLVV